MKKQFKIIILIAICLAVVGIYLGKNVYFKRESNQGETKIESQDGNVKNGNVPTLLEFSTET